MDYSIRDIAGMLADSAEQVCSYLLPSGKRDGKEWKCGNVYGDSGKSMAVCIRGNKAGVWSDFATGESGDLIDLWRLNRCNGSVPEALRQIRQYLNIPEPKFYGNSDKQYSKPVKPKCSQPTNKALEYLKSRGFTDETITAFQIGSDDGKIYFPFKQGNELVFCKWRSITDKTTAPTSKDQKPILFGWQTIPDDAREICIVEGEFDAMAMYQYGYPALSVPFGGGTGGKQNWIENEYQNLARFDKIYLVMDNDQTGQDAAKDIAKRLGFERCLNVILHCKDANECLQVGVPIERMQQAIDSASYFDPKELKSANHYTDAVIRQFYPEPQDAGIMLPWSKTAEKIQLRKGELSIFTGINGHGKSQVVGHVALGAIQQQYRVCIASMELRPEILLKRLVRQAGAIKEQPTREYIQAIQNWYADNLLIYECTGTAKQDNLLSTFAYARKRYGVDLFVIDSLMKCGIAEDAYSEQKLFVERLCDFKNEHNCHVILVTHSRKKESELTPISKMDIKGSGGIADLADTIVTVSRHKSKEIEVAKAQQVNNEPALNELKQKPDAFLKCDKQRNGEWEGSVALWFDKASYQYLEWANQPLIQYVNYQGGSNAA